jgi:hypothetical protein
MRDRSLGIEQAEDGDVDAVPFTRAQHEWLGLRPPWRLDRERRKRADDQSMRRDEHEPGDPRRKIHDATLGGARLS